MANISTVDASKPDRELPKNKGGAGRDPRALLPLTPAIFHIMLALANGEGHGYGIMLEVEKLTEGQLHLGPGTLYRSIQRMLVDGLIEELTDRREASSDDERRRYYQLTPFGQRVAQEEARRLATLVEAAVARKLLPGRSASPSEKSDT